MKYKLLIASCLAWLIIECASLDQLTAQNSITPASANTSLKNNGPAFMGAGLMQLVSIPGQGNLKMNQQFKPLKSKKNNNNSTPFGGGMGGGRIIHIDGEPVLM
jgi:hypothetical protein